MYFVADSDKARVMEAIDEWQKYTCLKFLPETGLGNSINFQNGAGCASYIGMIGGSQLIYLAPGCRHVSYNKKISLYFLKGR